MSDHEQTPKVRLDPEDLDVDSLNMEELEEAAGGLDLNANRCQLIQNGNCVQTCGC